MSLPKLGSGFLGTGLGVSAWDHEYQESIPNAKQTEDLCFSRAFLAYLYLNGVCRDFFPLHTLHSQGTHRKTLSKGWG